MLERCYYKKCINYHRYGGRGIKVCPEWRYSFETFMVWTKKNGYDEKLQLDRIDNNCDYSPTNCRFVTVQANSRNRHTNVWVLYDGSQYTIEEFISKYALVSKTTVNRRRKKGWSILDAVFTK